MPTNSSPNVQLVFEVVASKWAISILHALAQDSRRPLELTGEIGGVSQKMLTQTLRRLEDRGLVARKVHAQVPPRVDYSLTPLGVSLLEPLEAFRRWAEAHQDKINFSVGKRTAARKKPGSSAASASRRARNLPT